MTTALKVLGQSAPAITTPAALYTVPAATTAAISSLVVCNRNSASTTFRVSVRIAGAADAPEQYLFYDTAVAGNDTFIATIGVTLAATDVISVYSGSGDLSFSVFGQENS